MIAQTVEDKTRSFIKCMQKVTWFSNSGELSDKYTVTISFIEAWDTWNKSMIAAWSKESHDLEKLAIKMIGDESIDYIFGTIAEGLGPKIESGFCEFQNRLERMGIDSQDYGLGFEIIDFIKRDTAWACIEEVIEKPGFFSKVLRVNADGRWACSWDGIYPEGRFVVM